MHDLLLECLIYQVAAEMRDKADVSYFIAKAWVEDPDPMPTEVVLMERNRNPCTDPGICGCTEHLPRLLHHPVLMRECGDLIPAQHWQWRSLA